MSTQHSAFNATCVAAGDLAAVILMLIVPSPKTPELIVEAVRAGAKGYTSI
ncbi:MAG: hypothetical protein ACP5E9_04760 [Candidatus Methanospirareceae archaeon]